MKASSRQIASGENHLLLLRFSAMGDVAMLAPVVNILVKQYPDLRITVLTREFFKPIFNNIPRVTVLVADLKGKHKGISGLQKLAGEIKNLDVNAIGDMHNVLRSKVLRLLLLGSGTKFSIIDKGRAEKKSLTNSKNKVFKQLKSTHQRYADVLADLGYNPDLTHHFFLPKIELASHITEITGNKTSRWIGFAPFAAHSAKTYPLELVTEVLAQISKMDHLQIFLFGGGQDEITKLESLASKFEHTISLAGKLKFEEELKVISNLDLMVSMDSGNAHLAAMYGVKVLTLWGVTHPYAGFGAFGQPDDHHLLPDLEKYPAIPTSVYGNSYPDGYENVMESISPYMVVGKIEKML